MSIEETEQRVQKAFEAFGDNFDFRPTHWNGEALRRLKNAIELHGSGIGDDEAIKHAIREVRNVSSVGWIDLSIRVCEPSQRGFNRMCLLFKITPGDLITRRMNEAERKAYLERKTLDAVATLMSDRILLSDKIKQQFEALIRNSPDFLSEELTALMPQYETYNPYHKRLVPPPAVELNYDKPDEAPQKELPFVPEATDNSEFEAKLPAAKPVRQKQSKPWPAMMVPDEPFKLSVTAEIRSNGDSELKVFPIHEEFAAFCDELHAQIYGHH